MAEKDFNFWKAQDSVHEDKFTRHKSHDDDLEFHGQDHNEQGFCASTSPLVLWKSTNGSRNIIKHESSPLLLHNHQYNYSDVILPRSRRQTIIDGRKELMDSIRNMPDSCYELSLKDIVDEKQHNIEENGQEDSRTQIKKQMKMGRKKELKKGHILRSESMESRNFMIKMFLPTSLASMKKTKARNCSRDSWRSSSDGPDDYVVKDSWIKWLIFGRKSGNISRSNTNGSTSSSSSISSTNRCAEDNYIPGCGFFFLSKKRNNKGKWGCIC